MKRKTLGAVLLVAMLLAAKAYFTLKGERDLLRAQLKGKEVLQAQLLQQLTDKRIAIEKLEDENEELQRDDRFYLELAQYAVDNQVWSAAEKSLDTLKDRWPCSCLRDEARKLRLQIRTQYASWSFDKFEHHAKRGEVEDAEEALMEILIKYGDTPLARVAREALARLQEQETQPLKGGN